MYSLADCQEVIHALHNDVNKNTSCLIFMEALDALGKNRRFVVDTGASSTFISAEALDCFDHHIVNRNGGKATLANGTSGDTLGLAKVSIKLHDGRKMSLLCKILRSNPPVGIGFIGCNYTSDYDILSSRMVLKHIETEEEIPIIKEALSVTNEQEWINFSSEYGLHRKLKHSSQEGDDDANSDVRVFDSIEGTLVSPEKFNVEQAQTPTVISCEKDYVFSITDASLIPDPPSKIEFDINPELPLKIRKRYLELLNEFKSVFVFKASELGLYAGPEEYQINLTSTRSQRGQHIPIPFHLKEEFKSHIQDLLSQGLIEPTTDTRYSHSFLAVKKKDGTTRWCSDMRAINAITEDDSFPLPLIAEILQTLSGNEVYCSLDLISAFNQFKIAPENRHVFAFTDPTTNLRYQWKRCFFGLKSIPQFLSYIMSNRVFAGKDPDQCKVYIDDITCCNRNHDEMLENLRDVLIRLDTFNLKLKLKKCSFGYTKINQFGFSIDKNGCTIAKDRMESLSKVQRPTTKKALHSSLGAFGYFRNVLPDFASYSSVLTPLLSKDTPFLEWSEEADQAWQGLIEHAQSPEIICKPDPNHPFIVTSDASEKFYGGMLTQEFDGQKRLIAVHSAHFPQNKYAWAIHVKELISLTAVVEKWHSELIGRKFKIRSDNSWVVRLLKYGNNVVYSRVGPAIRCIMKLGQYDFDIEHCPGHNSKFLMADLLSRRNEPYFLDHGTNETKTVGGLLRPLVPDVENTSNSEITSNPENFPNPQNTANPSNECATGKDENPTEDVLFSIPFKLPETHSRKEIRDFIFSRQDEFRQEICEAYRNRKDFDEDELTVRGNLIVPRAIITDVLRLLHRHCGIHREYAFLKNCDIFWDGMATDIRQYVLSCESCSRVRKIASEPKVVIEPRIPLRPFESVSIDINQCGQGDTAVYILGLIDHYSKFILLKKVPSPGIYDCLDTILVWALEYNLTECSLRADNAFRRPDFVEMCNLLNIHCRFSVPGNSTSNAEIERAFRTVNEKFRLFDLANENIDVAVSFIQAEMNSTPITDCGVAPYEVIFGVTPIPSLLEPLPVSVERNLMNYARNKYDRLVQLSSCLEAQADHIVNERQVSGVKKLHQKGDKVRILVPRKPGTTKWASVPYAKEVYTIIDVRRPTRTYLIEFKPEGRQPIRKLVHHNRTRKQVEFKPKPKKSRSLSVNSDGSHDGGDDDDGNGDGDGDGDADGESANPSPEPDLNAPDTVDPLNNNRSSPESSRQTRTGRQVRTPQRFRD